MDSNVNTESAAEQNGSIDTSKPVSSTPGARPSSGRFRSLRRRFTTPADIAGVSAGALDLAISNQSQSSIQSSSRKTSESVAQDITVSDGDSLADVQALIIHLSDNLRCLRFRYCRHLTSSDFHEILKWVTPKLLAFEVRELDGHSIFDLSHLEHLASKCKHIRALHFEDCFDIDSRCLEKIGAHLLELQNIAFVHTKRHPWKDNPIHEIVTRIPFELHSIKFVGFDDIADFHVNYAVDCYSGSLNAIAFGNCPNITDRGVEYIAANCKLLRHIELFNTNITDSALWIIAKHCSNLQFIDLSNCPKITDYGVKELVSHSSHLRSINLSGNAKLRDLAFQSIVRQCASIARIRLNGTGVTRIPASIIARKLTLRKISVDQCQELTTIPADLKIPPGSEDADLLTALMERFRDRNLNYRLKMFVLGSSGSGKSSIIRALTGQLETTWNHKGPHNENLIDREVSEDERTLTIDEWECSGKEVLTGVHPVYLTDNAVYILSCNLEESASVEKLPLLVHTIYAKARRPQIYVVATRGDKYSDAECRAKLDILKRSIDRAELVRINTINMELALYAEVSDGPTFQGRIQDLQRQANEKYTVRKMTSVTATTGKGLETIKRDLLNICLDGVTMPHLKRPVPPGWIELHDELIKMRDAKPLLTWHEFEDVAFREDCVSKPRIVECFGFLQQTGIILDIRNRSTLQPTDLICINPIVLARTFCAMHIDDHKRSFKFEAKRFWPRDLGVGLPDAHGLAAALEELPNRGMVREALLPLVWQDATVAEDQLLRLQAAALNAGLLAVAKSSRPGMDSLTLPHFPKLNLETQYIIPLLGLLPDSRPQLNWTSRPFRGDLQISLHAYVMPTTPPGFMFRYFALANRMSITNASYHFYWKHGLLIRNADLFVYLSHETEGVLEISARITSEEEQEHECVDALWAEVCYFLDGFLQYVETGWPGLRCSISMSCYGEHFYTDLRSECEPEIPFVKVFHCAQERDDIAFKNQKGESFVEIMKLVPHDILPTNQTSMSQWVSLVAAKRHDILDHRRLSLPGDYSTSQESSPSALRPKKKRISLNWDVPDGEHESHVVKVPDGLPEQPGESTKPYKFPDQTLHHAAHLLETSESPMEPVLENPSESNLQTVTDDKSNNSTETEPKPVPKLAQAVKGLDQPDTREETAEKPPDKSQMAVRNRKEDTNDKVPSPNGLPAEKPKESNGKVIDTTPESKAEMVAVNIPKPPEKEKERKRENKRNERASQASTPAPDHTTPKRNSAQNGKSMSTSSNKLKSRACTIL